MTVGCEAGVPLDQFLEAIERIKPPRVSGTGVFMAAHPEGVPFVLQRHLTYNKVLPREVVMLAIMTEEVPEVDEAKRLHLEPLPQGLYRLRARYGFMERPDVGEIIARARDLGLTADKDDTIYYLRNSSEFRRTGWWSWGRESSSRLPF